MNEVQPAVYRAAIKLRSLQKLCQMDVVQLHLIGPALRRLGGAVAPIGKVGEADVGLCLQRLFQGVLQVEPGDEVSSHVVSSQEAPRVLQQTTRLLFKLFDREQTSFVPLRAVETVLVALSGDTLSAKHRALYQLAESYGQELSGFHSGTVCRSALRAMLDDLSQVPAVVQESHVFGQVETAVTSCFQGVLSAGVSEEHFLGWLQSEPQLLLWLSALYRISVSETVVHPVSCHVCKAYPVIGLRYRCLKCLNLHVCQICFFTQRGTRKHKASHPVLEHCTQPSLRESLTSLAHNAQHKLLRRHRASREAGRRNAVRTAEAPGVLREQQRTPTWIQQPQPSVRSESGVRSELSVGSEPGVRSKAMQTDPALEHQREPKDTDMALRDLQRDKRELEKQFQEWRAAAQSEHSSLESKCFHLEATMEVLVQHNQNLQEELSRVQQHLESFSKEEDYKHGSDTENTKKEMLVKSVGLQNWLEDLKTSQGHRKQVYTQSNTVHLELPGQYADMTSPPEPMKGPENKSGKEEEPHLNQSDTPVGPEEKLYDLVQKLKGALSLCRNTGQAPLPSGELLVAAEAVGDSISQLARAVSLPQPSLCKTLTQKSHPGQNCAGPDASTD